MDGDDLGKDTPIPDLEEDNDELDTEDTNEEDTEEDNDVDVEDEDSPSEVE